MASTKSISTALCIEITLHHSIPRNMKAEHYMKQMDFVPEILSNIKTALSQNQYTEGTYASQGANVHELIIKDDMPLMKNDAIGKTTSILKPYSRNVPIVVNDPLDADYQPLYIVDKTLRIGLSLYQTIDISSLQNEQSIHITGSHAFMVSRNF